MRRHIKIAIAITMMGLFALMFWQTFLDVTGRMLPWLPLNRNPSTASPSIHTYQFRDLHRCGENSFPSRGRTRATLFCDGDLRPASFRHQDKNNIGLGWSRACPSNITE